jgi:RNA recognition motif-containing protein
LLICQSFLNEQGTIINYLFLFFMNIFVANLNYGITGEDLKEIFGEYGNVTSARVVTDRETRRSKGFGFVEIESDSDAQRAIEELNEASIKGRNIVVKVAEPSKPRD